MKIQTFFMQVFILGIWLLLISGIQAQIKELPDLTFRQETGKEQALSKNIAKVLYFFDENALQNRKALEILNQIGYAFKTKELEVFAICLSSEEKPDLQEMQEIANYISFLLDPMSIEFQKLGISKSPIFLISDEDGHVCYCDFPENLSYTQLRQQVRLAMKFITPEESQKISSASDFFASKNWVAETEKTPKTHGTIIPSEIKPPIVEPEKNLVTEKKAMEEKADKKKFLSSETLSWDQEAIAAIATRVPVTTSITKLPLVFTEKGVIKSNLPDQQFFSFFVGFLVKLFPLFLWGWGILYTLSKILKYNGMLWSFLACLIIFSLNLIYLLMQIPMAFAILYYPLLECQQFLLCYYNFLEPFSIDTVSLILCQFALLAGLSSRYKREKECLPA